MYLRRVEDVLGRGWENHVEGQKLKGDGDSFRLKLNTQPIFDNWVAKVQERNLGVSGRIFAIDAVRRRQDAKPMLRLRVNFLPEIITLSKEVSLERRSNAKIAEKCCGFDIVLGSKFKKYGFSRTVGHRQ